MPSDASSIYPQGNLNSRNLNELNEIFEFEDFRLDSSRLMLYKNDTPIALAPKVVETLVALIEKPGRIVSKDEMMRRVWADSFVEESNLTQNIYLLRKTLGKRPDGKDLIETFRRRGYRFNGEIRKIAAEIDSNSEPGKQADTFPGQEIDFHERANPVTFLAVLPLKSESPEASAEYLSDGITESIINRLSSLSQLRVVARNTVFRYKNQDVMAHELGARLGVNAVLTGRVLLLEERLIVRIELVDAENGWQIWGEQYNRPLADVFEVQEIIAREISENLQLKLTGEEQKRLAKRDTKSTEAYSLYVKGRYYLNRRLTETIEQAAEFFQQAIDVDSGYALAFVGLADCFPLLSLYGALTPHDAYPKAKAAAIRALEIDETLAEAHNSLGVIKLFYEWDWAGAESAFRQAIRLNPGYADARQRYGMFLTTQERFAEAESQLARAQELDPLSLITKTIGAYPFYYSHRFDEAAARFSEVIAIDRDYSMAHFRLGLTYAQKGEFEKALAEVEISQRLSGDRDTVAAFGYVHALAGNLEEARAALAELAERERSGFVSAYDRALIKAGSGEPEAALDWLEKAFAERSYWLIYLKTDPALKALHENARFINLVEKIFWKAGEKDV
jgi:TolB-like protein/Flp pilus assembly protein TadD